jgi:ABC-type sugar transport system ATPase subunit
MMNELVEQGMSIIMISSEMEELLGMSDRVMVLYEGRLNGELPKEEFSQNRVLEMASGM